MVIKFLKKAISVYSGIPLHMIDSEAEEERKKAVIILLKSESLSCNKCNGLSIPLYDSENKYRCIKCGRQFSNTRHNISSKIRRKTYNECIDEVN
jgi:DNA-directed RNA polymerase subunit RPC12/RpoP